MTEWKETILSSLFFLLASHTCNASQKGSNSNERYHCVVFHCDEFFIREGRQVPNSIQKIIKKNVLASVGAVEEKTNSVDFNADENETCLIARKE